MKKTFTLVALLAAFLTFASITITLAQNAPTGFNAGTRTTTSVQFSWTDNGGGNDFYIVRNTTSTITNLANGSTYTVGQNLANGTVVGITSSTTFTDSPPATGTQYFYKVFNHKNGGDLYSSALTGNLYTISDVPASHVVLAAFSNITTIQIRANWNASTGASGNGTNRLVIVKKGSPVDATPDDGTSYTANTAFGTVGTEIGPAGNFVVYNGTAQLVTVTGLNNGDYYFKVFSFNGANSSENYLTGTMPTDANQGTVPTAQPTTLNITAPLNNGQGYTLSWTPVPATTVDGYIVVRRSGSAPTNTPSSGTTYTVGATVGAPSDIVAYVGSASTFNETTLTPATNYFYRVYSYNGSGTGINYLTGTPLSGNRRTFSTEPADQATDITYGTPTNTTMTVNWIRGTPAGGNNVIIVGKAGGAPTAPTDGTTYTASAAFGSGTSTDGGSSFVVYKGTASTVPVTSLTVNTNYFFQAFEFNTTAAGDENYNGNTGTNNDGTQSQATANEPTNQVTAPATPFANITGTTMRVTWTAAVAGARAPTHYLVNAINKTAPGIYKTVADGSPVADDTDLSSATGNLDGAQNIAFGTNLANWTGLDPGQEYEFQIYSYRTPSTAAAFDPDFKTSSPATVSGFTEPAGQSTITFGAPTNSSVSINLSAVPSAGGVVVLRRQGSAPTAPSIADGATYTVGTTNVAGGTNEVVYNGPIVANFVDDDQGGGLNASTTYHYISFSYSGTGSKINYLTTGIAAAVTSTTLAAGSTTTVTAASGGETSTIPSTTTITPGVSVFNFTVVDNSGSSNKTKISGITINRKDLASGDIDDWAAVLGGARLSGSHGNTGTTGITPMSVGVGPNITTNSIIFSGIPITAEALGELDNGETLTYTLEVWLKPNLGSATIDGTNFVFQVTPNASSFTTDSSGDSFDTSGSAIESGDANSFVNVTATQIRVTTQPSTPENATVVLATQPVFEATDVNNNRDRGFNNAVASVNTGAPGNLGPAYTAFNFINGQATFTDLRFNNVGNSTMTITSNSITSVASSSITINASTALTGGGLVGINPGPNLVNSTTNQAVFGFRLNTTGSALNFTAVTITTSSDPDNAFKPSSIKLVRSTDNSFSSSGDNSVVSSTYTTPGNSISFTGFSTVVNATLANFFIVVDVQDFFPSSLPNITLSLASTDFTVSAGNKTGATQTGTTYTLQDNTPPTVVSITPQLANNGPNGISNTAALTYTVVFSEPVTGVAATNFVTTSIPNSGSIPFPEVSVLPPASNSITGSGTTYTVTVNGAAGTGQLRLDMNASASIVDNQPNGNVVGFTGGTPYNVILPEPTNDNTNFAASTPVMNPNSSVTIDWKNPLGGQRPTHVLIVGIRNGVGAFPSVADATLIAARNNWNTAADYGAVIIDYTGSYPAVPNNGTYTIDNLLLSGQQYDFRIYPYTLSPNNTNNNVDYKTTAVLAGSYTVPLASAGTIVAGSTAALTPISSILAGSNTVFSFKIIDDGGTSADNAPTLISNLVINKTLLGANTITNWTDAIASAQLVDITQNLGAPIAGTVSANDIAFTLTTGVGNPGYIGQNLTKEYELRITLKNPFTATLDNQRFDFTINPNAFPASIIYAAGSSKIASGQLQSTGGETIQVVSTGLRFTTQPIPTSQLILTNFSTLPVIRAVDANGNTDVDFTGPGDNVTITTPGSVTRMNNPGSDVTSFVLTPVNGVINFSPSFQYNDTNSGVINGTLVATGGGLSSLVGAGAIACSAISVNYSNTSTVTSGSGIAAISSIAVGNINVFSFNITDDGGPGGDGAATKISSIRFTPNGSNQFSNFQDLMASATLSDGLNSQTITSLTGLNTADLTFSAIPNGAGTLGNVSDSNTKTYTLSITLKTPLLGGSLPATADNLKLVLDLIRNPNISFNATGSTIPLAAPTVNSGTSNGSFQVFATSLSFTTQPAATYLVNVPLSSQVVQPIVEAVDSRNNRDLDFVAPVSTTTSVVSRSGQPTTFRSNVPVGNGGIITGGAGVAFGFGDMQFTTIGTNAAITVTTSTPNANAVIPTAGTSSLFDVRVGQSSTIGTPVASASIPSTAYSAVAGTPAASTGPAQVFSFVVTDDAVLPNDGNPTLVSQIVFRQNASTAINSPGLADWRNAIAGAVLSDGNPANNRTIDFAVTPAALTATSITFSGIAFGAGQLGRINDSGTLGASSKTYTLSIWLKTPLSGSLPITIDGLKFGFDVQTITDVTTDPNGTSLVSGTAFSPSGNTVNVVASKINYLTLPFTSVPSLAFPSSRSIYDPFGGTIGVEAVDVNGNRDLNYTGTISGFSVANSLAITNNPNGQSFAGGTYTFDTNFQYTTTGPTANADGSLTMSASGGANPTLTSQTSTAINVFSSTDSYLYFDPLFGAQVYNNLVNQQASSLPAVDPNDGSLARLSQLVLSDGGAANFQATGTYVVVPDADRAFTRISSITFALTGAGTGDLRTLALYDNATGNKVSSDQPASASVTFSGLSIQAADGATTTFSIRGTFKSTIALDRDPVTFKVAGVIWSAGSRPFNYNGGSGPFFGGVNGGSTSPINQVNVVATSLDFVTQPNAYAGKNELIDATTTVGPLFTGIVNARDALANLDRDFNFSYGLSAPAGPTLSTPAFTNGVLNLVGMRYTGTGIGTLVVTANGLTSNNSLSPNSIPCSRVDVIDVGATLNTNGVTAGNNLKGGTTAVIFGADITPAYFVSVFKGDVDDEPSLSSLTFSFDVPYKTLTRTTLKNFRIYESTSGSFSGSTIVTSIGGTVTEFESVPASGNFDRVKVTFSTARPLFTSAGQSSPTRTYYLQTDIDVTATNNTPKITPQLLDAGYLDDRIEVTEGSAIATVIGTQFSFASTRPPSLVPANCVPFSGQLNVNPATTTFIDLAFDVPVLTFDGVAQLYDRQTNALVATLTAANGRFINGTTTGSTLSTIPPVSKIRFNIPGSVTLLPDRVYYVTVPQGTFDPTALGGKGQGTGISDDQLNLYGGISYNGTMYFKIQSATPPKMIATDLTKYEVNTSVASLNASFDQKGKAYYLILRSGLYNTVTNRPTTAQILNQATYSVPAAIVTSGSFDINQLHPQLQFFSKAGNFVGGVTYDVWIYAENDASPPVPSLVYGASTAFTGGAAGPTFSFTQPLNPGLPIYQICPNSFTLLSQPIILRETANNTWGVGAQNFNILLPSGFNYDLNTLPSVTLVGADFGAAVPTTSFINSTLLRVSFSVSSTISLDRIVVSGMRVAPSSAGVSGDITRFAGTGLVNYPDGSILAKISANALPPQTFTNSYTTYNNFAASVGLSSVVTSIPDNFFDQGLARNAIKLIPTITPSNDYNASFFSGAGVTDDVLSLTGVSKNTAFDITMTHTDLNGCFLSQAAQYVVYDNTRIIPVLTDPTYGPKQALTNSNFITPSDVVIGTAAPTLLSTSTLKYNDIAGYNLDQMVLKIPKEVTSQTKVVTPNSQIIFGSAWQSQLDKVLNVAATTTISSGTYRDYKWDYSHVLNAKSFGVALNPYENFNANTPPNSNNFTGGNQLYFTGGSLGFVDFIAKFQSTADLTVFQPLVQRIQLFVPAVPIIEVVGQSFPRNGTTDPSKVYIFCEQGNDVLFNGFPAASPGKSKGYYSLYDSATNNLLYDGKNRTPLGLGFTDNANSNGTATLVTNSPAFLNNYKTIRVEYTYQDDNSPASGTGKFFIRIAPNPLANFTFSSIPLGTNSENASGPLAICALNQIDFDASSSTINGVPINPTKYTYTWNFDDSKSANPAPGIGLAASKPSHTFTDVRNYSVSLNLVSDVGCPSIPKAVLPTPQSTVPASKIIIVKVGDIPQVDFSFLGNCVGDAITFTDRSTTDVATSYGARYDWDYDSSNPANTMKFTGYNTANVANVLPNIFPDFLTSPDGKVVTNTYSLAKNYKVKLTVTTNVGCSNSTVKDIVQLPLKAATAGADFSEFFDANDGGWQALDLSGSTPVPGGSGSSWAWNDPASPGKWVVKSNYKRNERSALYTACLDLSNVPRPVISFFGNIGLATGEGLVLQYSKDQKNIYDPTKEWDALGTTIDDSSPGLDWYSAKALPSNPGTGYTNSRNASGYGWAGSLGNIVPKHKVEDITDPTIPPVPNNRVILRFAFAALNAGGSGVKIDSIRVGSRTRTILFENFTTTDGGTNATLNSRLKADADFIKTFTNANINSTQLVNLNYHIGFIGKDPFNLDNPADPSSRALYYNVNQAPYAFLDGTHGQKNGSDLFRDWGQAAYDLRTLQLANADFTPTGPFVTNVVNNAADKTMEIEVYVKPTRDLPASTRLHIGVLEDVVTKSELLSKRPDAVITTGELDFNYVVKKMVPDALGTKYPAQTFKRDVLVRLAPGGKVGGTEKFKWSADKLYSNKLTLVVFLQDTTREVYQADLFRNLTPPALITGFEPTLADEVFVYPNPTDQEFTVELPMTLKSDAAVRLIDPVGRALNAGTFAAGKNTKTISTSNLAGGIYIVEISAGEGTLIRKKVMVAH